MGRSKQRPYLRSFGFLGLVEEHVPACGRQAWLREAVRRECLWVAVAGADCIGERFLTSFGMTDAFSVCENGIWGEDVELVSSCFARVHRMDGASETIRISAKI
jgi:hypothetical protein